MRIYLTHFKIIIPFIVFISSISFSQDIPEENNVADSTESQVKPAIAPITAQIPEHLEKYITASKSLAAVGCVFHFTGTSMTLASFLSRVTEADRVFNSFFSSDQTLHWLGLVGVWLDVLGPLPSCIGATLLESAMEEEDISFPRHTYLAKYALSGIFWALNGGATISQYIILSHGRTTSSVGYIITAIAWVITYGAAEVYSGMTAIGPIVYARKAELRLQKKNTFNFKVLPNFTLDGRAGVNFVGTF